MPPEDEAGLRDLLIKSTRVMLFITVPLYALCVAYLEPLIKILTGLKSVEPSTYWVGQALLLATFSSLVTSSCSKRILMMCGWERALLKASLVDAGVNLVASIVLVSRFGVLGVALGTMIPTFFIGWLWIVPLTARFLKISVFEMLASFVAKVWLPLTAALGVLAMISMADPDLWKCGVHRLHVAWDYHVTCPSNDRLAVPEGNSLKRLNSIFIL